MARSVRRRTSRPARRALVRIEDVGAAGDGVAIADGARLFVPLTAPGDVAEIDVADGRGRLVALIEKSPERAEPPCPHYGECGGCSLQHVTPEYYRAWKRRRVAEPLQRAGLAGFELRPTVEIPSASRRRATFAVRKSKSGAVVGFNARRSSDIVDVGSCLILDPAIRMVLPMLADLAVAWPGRRFDLAATLCDNGLDLAIQSDHCAPTATEVSRLAALAKAAGAVRLSFNRETLIEFAPPIVHFDGVAATPPPGGFLQASRAGEAALIDIVKAAARGAGTIVDLFCGCGTFTLPLARHATVQAFDKDQSSIDALRTAAAAAQRTDRSFRPVAAERRDLFERPLAAEDLNRFDAVLLDPPRAGARAQVEEIAKSASPLVIAASCNPATFARDAAILSAGGHALQFVTPVDQFVYSAHVELVGIFRRR